MKRIWKWLNENDRLTLIFTVLSGVFLALSLIFPAHGSTADFAWGAIVLSGTPIAYGALKRLLLKFDIKAGLLVTIALIACIVTKEYFAAGEVAFIMMIGELLENFAVRRSHMGLEKLIRLKPTKARVQRNGEYVMLDASEVEKGDIIRISAGEAIPVDGLVIEGFTTIDQSVMTGESIPVDKAVGDEVFSGTTNIYGNIVIKATSVGEDSAISKMIALVKQADENKAPIMRIMDKWATYLVIIALSASLIIGFATMDIMRAVTVLVVFCPCALVLATPTAIAAGIGNATRHGIIIKSGEALEKLGNVKRIAFDKTGTLTVGKPTVQNVVMLDESVSLEEASYLTASAEMFSEHPFGKAIVRYAKENETQLTEPSKYEIVPGKGLEAIVDDKKMLVGNAALIKERGIDVGEDISRQAEELRLSGNTVIISIMNDKPLALITLADQLRKDSKAVVESLKRKGVNVTLLTGDHKDVAAKIAASVGIDDVKSELLPQDKVEVVAQFEQEDVKTCMVGDGINDAPALKSAYTGIAMAGIGSDIASDCADVVLVKDDISKLPYVFSLSQGVISKIKQNIIISMAINFAAIILAAVGILNPVSGAIVHNAGSVLVVINAAFLLRKKIRNI